MWAYVEPLATGDPTRVLTARAMPGARWFPGVRVNYASTPSAATARTDAVAVVARSQPAAPWS